MLTFPSLTLGLDYFNMQIRCGENFVCVYTRYCVLDLGLDEECESPLANGYIFTNDLNYFLCVSRALGASVCVNPGIVA